MQTYFSSVQELWDQVQSIGGNMMKDFELTHYGDSPEEVSEHVIMYKGITHDIYKVNKTVEMLYNKLQNGGLKNNIHLTQRRIHRPEKYNGAKDEYVIALYPGMKKA